MNSGGFWSRAARERISRRRLIAGAAGFGAGAAALSLVGCGGDGDSEVTRREGKGLLATAEDTSTRAKPGGVFKDFRTADVTTWDPMEGVNPGLSNWVQSRFSMGVPMRLAPYDGARQGDLAESWEVSGDGLQWTFKLRPNATFPNLPGKVKRTLDAQDILFSYDRYLPTGEYRGALSNTKSPAGPISTMTAPDSRTIVMKLAFPFLPLLPMLDWLYILPKEAENKYDPKGLMLGTGPWQIEEYQPSVGITYKRNPDWHMKGRPFIEKVEVPILPEYATRLAQLRARRIHRGVLRQEDILPTKKDLPAMNLFSVGIRPILFQLFVFGLRPGSPFMDERLRQAVSMALDRDTYIDVFYNVPNFKAEGLDVETRYYTHFGVTPDKYYLNPQRKDFGPNAKYLQFNPTEAKRLAAAAGAGPGWKVNYNRSSAAPSNQLLALLDMLQQTLGWDIKHNEVPSVTNLLDSKGDFEGMTGTQYFQRPDPGTYYYHKYHSAGGSIRVPIGIDKTMDKMFDDQFRITDENKRTDIMLDIQRYLAQKMWLVPYPGQAEAFQVAWPDLKNFGVFSSSIDEVDATEQMALNYWIDPSAG